MAKLHGTGKGDGDGSLIDVVKGIVHYRAGPSGTLGHHATGGEFEMREVPDC